MLRKQEQPSFQTQTFTSLILASFVCATVCKWRQSTTSTSCKGHSPEVTCTAAAMHCACCLPPFHCQHAFPTLHVFSDDLPFPAAVTSLAAAYTRISLEQQEQNTMVMFSLLYLK